MNAGGAAYTDELGRVWSADAGYNAGSPFTTTAAVTAASGAALYQDERFGQGTFGYDFAVANGRYLVTLKFAEISIETTGQRLFHVDLNGTRVLTNFDVYAAAGGPRKAVDLAFPVDVTDGHVRLNFTSVVSTATVSAIEIAGGKTTYTQVRTWTYDAATQRLSSVTMPETGTTSYSYYDSGLVQSKTDANGVPRTTRTTASSG